MAWYGNKSDAKKTMPRSVLKNSNRRPFRIPVVKKYGKQEEAENEEDLLVFGYACKIFPPDEHSRAIERGEHLISWHDDASLQLLIDRYDARASLHDLSEFEGDSWNKPYQMSEEESRIEALCDHERYLALHMNIAEENIRHEEELKRLHASIAAGDDGTSFREVSLNYEDSELSEAQQYDPSNPTVDEETCDADEKEETPFMAPESLAIPSDMEIPPTEKMHAIIEKTAAFVSNQGAQMEIVLKAKQANNSQFQFLQFDHYLNPYYKHMVKRIKEGKYTPGVSSKKSEDDDDDSDDSSDEGGYLHPSLLAGSSEKRRREENKEKFKAIQKVDPDHPLAKLIEKGKKANAQRQYAMMQQQQQSTQMQAAAFPVADNNVPSVKPSANADVKIPVTVVHPPPAMQSQTIAHVDAMTPIVPPPPDIQPMVDSVAKQIAEDGEEVERSMCARDDPMLSFLLPWHELYPYYSFRKSFFQQQLQAQRNIASHSEASADKDSSNEVNAETEQNSTDYKPEKSAPISFAIKPKKETTNKPSLLNASKCLQILDDESDNEEENVQTNKNNADSNDSKMETEKAESNSIAQAISNDVKEDKDVGEDTNGLGEPTETANEVVIFQTEEKLPPSVPKTEASKPATSTFAVVTPSGTTASLSNIREKQAARRQKAMLFLKMKNDVSPNTESAPKPLSAVASEDIFDIEEDAASPVNKSPCATDNSLQNASTSLLKTDLQPPTKRSVPPSAAPSSTLKDLVAAASSRSNTPNSLTVSIKRDGDRSRSHSRSRYSSPSYAGRTRRSRSGSRGLANLPSSYRKTPSPSRRERSPSRDRRRGHKRHRYDDRESKHRRRESSNSPSRKSKKHGSKSKKRHKKKEKKKSKKRKTKRRDDSYEEGERTSTSSDEASSVENHTNHNKTALSTDGKENSESEQSPLNLATESKRKSGK